MMSGRPAQSASARTSWPGRGHVATFIRCLHLLDLDLLEDWPGITEQTFSARSAQHNLKQRIKAVEWSFYRLFEIYDSDSTKDKLGPFFPPTAPLQSLNLRAALYRCLNELKKNGVLGKDILLRKTMLDECKGERFEEVIAGFALTVLRKAVKENHGTLGNLPKTPLADDNILPLILAHRNSLQCNLKIRQEQRERAAGLLDELHHAGEELRQRRRKVQSQHVEVDLEDVKELTTLVNTNWLGERGWSEVLLRGNPPPKLLHVSDTQDLNHIAASFDPSQKLSEPLSLVEELDQRIKKHQLRLAEWRLIAKDLKPKQQSAKDNIATTSPQQQKLKTGRFTKHKALNMNTTDSEASYLAVVDPTYQKLLERLEDELSSPATRPRNPASSREADTLPQSTESMDVVDQKATPNHEHFTSELANPAAAQSVDKNGDVTWSGNSHTSTSPAPSQNTTKSTNSPWIPIHSSATTAEPAPPELSLDDSPLTSKPVRAGAASRPTKFSMSLAERTRASMSLLGRNSMLSEPESSATELANTAEDSAVMKDPISAKIDRRTTLLERTRESMSLFVNPPPTRSGNLKHDYRASQIFPVNQFETPGKRPIQGEPTPGSDLSTPREKLFDDTTDYASVFKSRPKLAMSPALSPERSTFGLDSILERDMEHLDLDSDSDTG